MRTFVKFASALALSGALAAPVLAEDRVVYHIDDAATQATKGHMR